MGLRLQMVAIGELQSFKLLLKNQGSEPGLRLQMVAVGERKSSEWLVKSRL